MSRLRFSASYLVSGRQAPLIFVNDDTFTAGFQEIRVNLRS